MATKKKVASKATTEEQSTEEETATEEDILTTIARKDVEFKRAQGKAGDQSGWEVTPEKLRDGLRYVDMGKHAIPLKK